MKIELSVDELLIIIHCLMGSSPSKDKEQQTIALYDRLCRVIAGI